MYQDLKPNKGFFCFTKILIGLISLIMVVGIVLGIIFGIHLLQHPEAIGNFFGQVTHGYNSAK